MLELCSDLVCRTVALDHSRHFWPNFRTRLILHPSFLLSSSLSTLLAYTTSFSRRSKTSIIEISAFWIKDLSCFCTRIGRALREQNGLSTNHKSNSELKSVKFQTRAFLSTFACLLPITHCCAPVYTQATWNVLESFSLEDQKVHSADVYADLPTFDLVSITSMVVDCRTNFLFILLFRSRLLNAIYVNACLPVMIHAELSYSRTFYYLTSNWL